MKQLFYILALIFLISCSPKPNKKDLIGVWSMSHPNIEANLIFTQDSAFVHDILNLRLSYTWKLNDSIIYYTYHGDSIHGYYKNWQLNYRFNSKKDSLYISQDWDSSNFEHSFIRIFNGYEYYMNQRNTKIDLPEKNDSLIFLEDSDFGLNIYVSYRDEKIKAQIEDEIPNLDKFLYYNYSFMDQIEVEEESKVKIVLFIDRNVPKIKEDSIKQVIRKGNHLKHKIFRVYTNKTVDYKNYKWNDTIRWYGIYEK